MAQALTQSGSSEPELVAGRYQIKAAIAKGGMGAVYRAHDLAFGREVALKRLLSDGDARRRTRMFEREFHTLAGLRHPRIIEVYDYGIDARGAYYTMELLDGRDLRELAPLPYRTACRYLRDVASSLALLHARNLLHRDLSPRNVRVTSNDRAKLIDFGALSSFGRSVTVVGTAPGIPPEALYGMLLDQRADLYSLGALAYWTVTGRHAYDVRGIDELPESWSKPLIAPSLLVPHRPGFPQLPPELDELIAALLSKNPFARPLNAAEVIAKLAAIAQLPPDDEPLSALSYLHGGRTVGRARERAKLRKRAKAALAGAGSVITIESEAGMGCGRMLADLSVETSLLGATAVVVDAGMHRGAYGVVDEIARALFAAQPERALSAMGEHAAALTRFLPGARSSTTGRTSPIRAERGGDPREARTRLQVALLAWFERLARSQPLVLAVHQLHCADESSAALLSALSHGIATRRMLLVLAYDPEEVRAAPMIAGLKNTGTQLVLRGLNREEVHALVVATFGEAPYSERLASWLHELTSGKPQACLDLIEHLIERDVIRFIEGVWVLPQNLTASELPADIGQALDARLAKLTGDALKLVLALSLHRGPAPLERSIAIANVERIAEPLRALSELERCGVISISAEEVRFVHAAVRDAALRRLADGERRRLHVEFGRLIEREDHADQETMLEAGWHLLHGGEERRGADLLAQLAFDLVQDGDMIPAALPALEAALQTYRRLGRPRSDEARLLASIAGAGYFHDRKVIERYADEAARAMQDVLGLSLARRLRFLGAALALGIGFGWAWLRLLLTVGPLRARRRFFDLIELCVPLAASSVALAALTLDVPRARRYARLLDPLRVLGPNQAPHVVSDFLYVVAALPEDRIVETIAGCRRLAERFESAEPIRNLPRAGRQILLANALYALGALETFRESAEALRIADRLETLGLKICELFANQIRANYHGLRGELARANEYSQRVATIAVQAGSGWLTEVWAPTAEILWHLLSNDAVGIRRTMADLDRLVLEIPALRRHALLAHGSYHTLRGDYATAHEIAAGVLAAAEPRAFIGWSATVAVEVRNLARIGELDAARRLGLSALARFDAEARTVTTMITPLVVELALVEAELGDLEAAATRIDDYMDELGDRGGPVTRGGLHEARARVALMSDDIISARAHLLDMQRWFLPTENPALIGRCERLSREVESGHSEPAAARDTVDLGQPGPDAARAQLRRCEPAQRAQRALELLLDQTGSASGYLFSYEHGELRLCAQSAVDPPSDALRAQVLAQVERYGSDDEMRTVQGETSHTISPSASANAHRVLLLTPAGEGSGGLAAAALAVGRRGLRVPARAFLAAVAYGVSEATSTTSASHTDAAPLRKSGETV